MIVVSVTFILKSQSLSPSKSDNATLAISQTVAHNVTVTLEVTVIVTLTATYFQRS